MLESVKFSQSMWDKFMLGDNIYDICAESFDVDNVC